MKKILPLSPLLFLFALLSCNFGNEETPRKIVFVPPPKVLPDSLNRGKMLFKQCCAPCHFPDDRKLTGPGLEGATTRVPSKEWLHHYVHNAQEMEKSGDAYAVALAKANNHIFMTPFPDLSDENIDDIFRWIDNGRP